jgi:hypothetical protein
VSVPANENAVLQRSLTSEEREAKRDQILAEQRQHDAAEERSRKRKAAAIELRKQRVIDDALARKRAKQTPEERARELWGRAANVLGKDEAARMEQRARDRRA